MFFVCFFAPLVYDLYPVFGYILFKVKFMAIFAFLESTPVLPGDFVILAQQPF
jgi:hypothetical protein